MQNLTFFCLIILYRELMDCQGESRPSNFSSNLDTKTVLILFVEIFFVFLYLVSLLLVIVRRAKKLIQLSNRKYYVAVAFYIASKLIICLVLIIKIVMGMADQWAEIDPNEVQLFIKTGLALANFSIVEQFLIALEIYLTHCFSAINDGSTKRRARLLVTGLKILQVMVGLFLLIPLIIYDVDELGFTVINTMDICLNLIIIISFLVTFFYLSFKMTGIMMEPKLNDVIKRIYKVQLIILVSRAITLTFEILLALYVLPNTFQEEVNSMSGNYAVILGILFVGTVLFMLITEGLPIMYSLRSSVIEALNYKAELAIQKQNLEESMIDKSQQEFQHSELTYKELKLKNFSHLKDFKSTKEESIWVLKKGEYEGKEYLIRISKNQISNYIFEDIENEVSLWAQLNLKSLSKTNFFYEGELVHFVEKLYNTTLDERVTEIGSENQSLSLALQLAEAIRQLHEKQLVHGCLTPSHIFIHESQVVVNGLGLHSLKKYLSLITGYTNKTIYTAIEHLKDKNNVILKPKKPADIYSFGIILYEIVTKNRQYRQLPLKDVQTKFADENFRPKLPEHIKLEIKNLIRKCWNESSEKRPSIEEVIETLRRIH